MNSLRYWCRNCITQNPSDCCRNAKQRQMVTVFFFIIFILFIPHCCFVSFSFVSFCLHSSCLPIENEIVEHWSASLGWIDAHLLLGIFYDEFSQVHTIFYVSALCFVESTMALFILRLLLPNTNNEKYFNYHRYFGWFFFIIIFIIFFLLPESSFDEIVWIYA